MSEKPIWAEFEGRIRASEPYRRLLERPGPVVRLPLPAAAWITHLLATDLERPLLVVAPRESDALAWQEALELFAGPGTGATFSAPSLTPYHETEISLQVRAQEAVALDRLLAGEVRTLIVTPRALFRRLPARGDFAAATRRIRVGDELALEDLTAHLEGHGYHRSDLVAEVGEYAVRGGVFDLFPPGEADPLRLDLFGDAVESIRRFGIDDQRSRTAVEEARVLPLSLFPSAEERAPRLAARMAELVGREAGMGALESVEALRRGDTFTGWENYLPLLHETAFLPDFMTRPLLAVVDPESVAAEIDHHLEQMEADCAARRERGRLAIPPERLEQPASLVRELVSSGELVIGALGGGALGGGAADGEAVDFAASTTDLFHQQLPRFPREVETARARGERLVIVAPAEHQENVRRFLDTYELPVGPGGKDGSVELAAGDLARGFRLPAASLVVFGERQIFARLGPARPRVRTGPFVSGLRDLRLGDFVVHSDHGIGQFVHLRTVGGDGGPDDGLPPELRAVAASGGAAEEVMEIEYAGGRSLLLPLSRLDLIQRYSGIEGVAPRLDRLGGTSWSRTKEKIRRGLRRLATDLLQLYAQRQMATAPAMPPDDDQLAQFEAAFEYEETPDQLEAVKAIKADLERERPMDRLLCGDVGFGKTEVAMRAAFKAVEGGYQVALLAPTTILADQHLDTFRRRFDGFPVLIEMVSRFRSRAEVRDIAERLGEGKVDVLIGTHRLLSKDLVIPRLGLLIVDEEQRFGVAQKERLKELKKNVHVLAMSATPVPRTLQLSLAGVRDLSVIETPPRDRMAVETAIVPFSRRLIREAVEFELERGGQIYYVYNRVEGIEEIATLLRELMPEVKLVVGHGQLPEGQLSRRMRAFKSGEYDLLLATTIIENGIDISNVNTMIVHHADRFGLAQLYQLRGRVGRGGQLAFCYLMLASDRLPTGEARHRLEAIREFTDLGAGFRVAARDLEIRGAGNLLGAEQSGHIAAVGIETYLKMLEEAVRELRGEEVEEGPSVSLDLPVAAAIPPEYVGDANLRMEIYRRIAAGEDGEGELLEELEDRFGAPPEPVRGLLELAAVKRMAESLRIQSVSARGARIRFRLRRDARVDVDRLIRLVSERPGASFSPTGVLSMPVPTGKGFVEAARATLEELRQ